MDAFLDLVTAYPTSVFTTINLIIVGIWLIMALGLLDIEIFDFDIDTDIDIDVDAPDADITGGTTFLSTLGLQGVPFFIVLTIIFFVSWLITYFSVKYLLFWNNFESLRYILGSGILVVSFLVSIPITARLIRPLRKLFTKLNHAGATATDMMGKQCKVRTSKVTPSFGEGECNNEGASLILKIRADEKYQLSKGDLVRIIDVDKEQSVFQVIPEDEFGINNI
ncbi:hypothetical protein FLL45_21790 [Aliikangiella marina]|uniref:DUF1449 family protein n=1 Tax=Aliikangiella marina TaxID=1712262 RepID=A0A545T181_9GAMM|nr:OB-fold-containig protein [Aliikangiella marina]TQV70962.1 hypothetical protein FLL45_21790 [Aliikangiella marina]